MGAPTVQKSALAPTTSTTAAATPGAPIPYTLSGALAVSTSPPVTPFVDTVISGLSATLGTPGSTATTVQLLVNGTVIASVVVPANQTYAHVAVSPTVALASRRDHYSLSVSVAGAGASDLGGEIETLVTH